MFTLLDDLKDNVNWMVDLGLCVVDSTFTLCHGLSEWLSGLLQLGASSVNTKQRRWCLADSAPTVKPRSMLVLNGNSNTKPTAVTRRRPEQLHCAPNIRCSCYWSWVTQSSYQHTNWITHHFQCTHTRHLTHDTSFIIKSIFDMLALPLAFPTDDDDLMAMMKFKYWTLKLCERFEGLKVAICKIHVRISEQFWLNVLPSRTLDCSTVLFKFFHFLFLFGPYVCVRPNYYY